MHRVAIALSVSLVMALLCQRGAHAQAAASTTPTVVVVIESGDGLPSAEVVRGALSHAFDVRVVLAREVTQQAFRPDALISISVDQARNVSVLYWDRTGMPDLLSAPTAAPHDHLDTVVTTLTAALMQRHMPELLSLADTFALDARSIKAGRMPVLLSTQAIYSALARLGSVPRRTFELSIEDF